MFPTPFLIVPSANLSGSNTLELLRNGGNARLENEPADSHEGPNTAERVATMMSAFETLIIATKEARRRDPAFQTALKDPQNDTICVSFQITDEILISFTERRPAQSNEVQQIISACINERTASIVLTGVSHNACSSDGQIHLDHIRNVMDQIASSGSQALDALTGRGGWVPLIGVPEDIEAAAHGCVQIIADRHPLQTEGVRTGSHIMGTPWSRPRTILDDVTMIPTPAEAAWLPQIATGDFVHVAGETPDHDRFTLTLAPYIARASITSTSPMDKERSLAAIATFRPEDEMEDEVFA